MADESGLAGRARDEPAEAGGAGRGRSTRKARARALFGQSILKERP